MVQQDLHIHTSLSSCAKPEAVAADYIAHAREIGLKTIAFTDHMWDSAVPGASSWYAPQNFEHILQLKKELPPSDDSLKILFGCETECDKYGTVGISEEVAAQLDILLVPNSHTHMRDFVIPSEDRDDIVRHGKFMVKHFMDIVNSPVAKYITAIPHPFCAVGCPEAQQVLDSIPDIALKECAAAAKEKDIALEINTSGYGKMSDAELASSAFVRLYDIARRTGCRFTIGSDAHELSRMDNLPKAEIIMKAAGIDASMLLWP